MKVTVVFDRERLNDRLTGGWGLSFLLGEEVLFDTGEKAEYTLKNMEVLGVDINKIKKVVISHNHWDHRQGLWGFIERRDDLEIFACRDFIEEFRSQLGNNKVKEVKAPQQISEGIYTIGGIRTLYEGKLIIEQFLVTKTAKGISLICGCSHPGILEVLEKVKETFPDDKIYSVIGGLHLMDSDKRFVEYVVKETKRIGVQCVGPSHCSGFEAQELFKETYGNNFIDIKSGVEFQI
ncbi:MAG: MBL fold metallo-hydrolase [Candidatus Omnitrophota bacterium]|nr:MAG: MBL fold metallo-hydrolase [Candidatus Omnitrophota bacterium]